MILTSLALAMSLQGAPVAAVAIKNDNPETWTVEYPRVIRPFVVNYRQCLNLGNRKVTGVADFEMQHRSDVPRCARVKSDAITESNAAMDGAKTQLGAEEVDQLFTNIELIHIARGRDLDNQFYQSVTAAEAAQNQFKKDRPRALVLELHDASVVKARTDAIAAKAGEAE